MSCMKLMIAIVGLCDIIFFSLSLCITSSLDRTEGQTKNRSVSMARVSCLFFFSLSNVQQLYMYTYVCTNQACTDEGQMMMMMVVVVDLPDECERKK
jgi:hypothetical protein